ncbi:replicative DNA helicase [Candidatus Aerophobetes bacterium]|uniref:Replicative DNA helicase n=1 Tax=Aerophobetes bacterium TaxID=2030807 RepID=A0A523VZ55_UNCAE|nr:MAG: replicative DNA helicase [Candidatus Aerophobetes bacterium]
MKAKTESTSGLEKVPPQNLEAERAVLGGMLLERETIPKVLQIITESESFYSEVHTLIYEGVVSLFNQNKPVDVVALKEQFGKKGKLKEVGGASYLAELVNSVPTTVNVPYYAQIVKQKHILRDLLKTADFIRSLSYDDSQELDVVLDKAQSSIFDITQQRVQTPYQHIKDVLTGTFERIEALYERKEQITGVPTGFAQLDRLTSGFQPSDLIVIAGRPSIGKTSLALNIAQYAGIEAKVPLVIFSLESAKEQLVERFLCSEARVDSQKLRTGFLSEDDWSRLTDAAGVLAEAPIYIDDSANIGVLEIRAKARQLKAEHDIRMAIIDYLQLMEGDRRIDTRQQQISEISRSLKALAKELNISVVAISQLSRAVEQREDKRPRLSDLRESGAIEQDADLVLSLYREHYYSRLAADEGKAEVIINKQRRGPTDKLPLIFISEYTRFENPELGEL